jgi:hypothetical protein
MMRATTGGIDLCSLANGVGHHGHIQDESRIGHPPDPLPFLMSKKIDIISCHHILWSVLNLGRSAWNCEC